MNPGEYVQPRVTKTQAHMPIVAGYVTGRFYSPVVSVSGYDPQRSTVLLENTGDNSCSVILQETDDYVSGQRVQIGGAIPLVAGGQKYTSWVPQKPYLEFAGVTGQGDSTLRVQIESQLQWSLMAFDKSEAVYPPQLVKIFPDPNPPPA